MKMSKKLLSLLLCAIMVLGSVAIGGNGFAGVLDSLSVKASAAKVTSYKTGDIIEFGWYPQSKETNKSITDALTASADNTLGWNSYNYYSGTGDWSDGQMKPSNYMRYTDVMYGSTKYRGVIFDSYRPYCTGYTSSNNEQQSNGYYTGTVYWFKYEPIKWRVLDPATGMIMAETILDSQAFNNYILSFRSDEYGNTAYWGNSSKTYYANNYTESSIRKWLNDDFYNTAFSSTQQNIIQNTTLDNSAYSTSYSEYNSESTNDKIYLLSWNDALNSNYGFSTSTGSNSSKKAQGSDYAKCQGLYVTSGNSCWRLRSPGYYSDDACNVDYIGGVYSLYSTSSTSNGVRPALNFNLNSEIFQSDVKDAGTASESGTETHTSPSDGDYKITLDANGGKFSDGTSTKTYYYDAGESLPSSLLSSNKPTKNGYTFNRWNDILPLTMPSKNITFKAEWKINIPDEPGEPEYTSAQKITISNHVNFVSGGQMNTMIDEYGIYNNTWYAENGKRQWAVRVWDTLGDVAELSTFKFDDLQISADFYEIYLTDLLLKTVEKSEVDIYDDAFSNMKKYGGMILTFLQNDADWEKKFSLAEKKEVENFFKFDNEVKLSQGATEKLTALSKKVFKTDNINLGKDVLTGVSEAINICDTIGKCTDVVDVYLSALNAYTVTKAVQNVGEDFFDVCYDTAEQMRKDGRSKYANWFEQDVDKFKSAVLDGTIFNQLYSEVYDKAIWTVYDLSLKDTLKTWAYRGIQKALNLTSVSPIAWVVATYTATYEVLDLITQLGSRGDNYYYLTYVCPVEYAMGKVCKTYGSNLLSNKSYDNATKLDCCFSMLRRTNNFLWKEYADFCASNLLNKRVTLASGAFQILFSKESEEDYNYCTLYASFWDKVSCHKDNNALIAEYKTTGYFCPVDIYVYDANNKLALSIVDDVITRKDGNVFALCSNGEKSVVTPSDQKYSVKIVGTDNSTFDYCINESSEGESTRTVSFEQIDFTKGQTFAGNLPKGVDCNSNEYSLVSNSKTIYCDYDSNNVDPTKHLKYSVSNGKATIIGCDRDVKGKLIIPQTIDGYTIIGIGNTAFANCKDITEITIPATVQNIGYGIFGGCSKLSKIIVDANNKNFSSDDDGILFNKNRTELIQYPIGSTITEYTVPYGTEKIGDSAFVYSSFLKKINLPESVIEIGQGSFAGCSVLEYVHIPSSVKTIGDVILYSNSMYPCTAYICSDSNNCYAKTYAQANNYTFRLCSSHNGVKNPTAHAVINVATEQKIDYRSIVTIKATAKNIPDGYMLAMYIDGKTVKGTNTEVNYEYGELKSDLNYSVKVIDSNGKVQKDSNGNDLSKDSKITVNAGFFKKLIAFFRGLFKSLPKVEVKP